MGIGIVNGVDCDRKYHIEEIMEMYHKGMLQPIGIAGYIVRADADGMVGFVPASESTLFNSEAVGTDQHGSEVREGRTYPGFNVAAMRDDVEHEHPMVRRKAEEVKASMVQRLLNTARVHGTIPGLTDEQISTMIGEKWTTGVSVVTEQMLARVSMHLLGQGEAMNKEADRHRSTRKHALA